MTEALVWDQLAKMSQIPIGREKEFITKTLAATWMETGKVVPLGFLPGRQRRCDSDFQIPSEDNTGKPLDLPRRGIFGKLHCGKPRTFRVPNGMHASHDITQSFESFRFKKTRRDRTALSAPT
jgi:hypothetical protein